MCTSFYLAALRAAVLMGEALGAPVPLYAELLEKGRKLLESELWNGEYFVQKVEWKNLRAKNPLETKSMVGELLARGDAACSRRRDPSTSTARAASRTASSAPGWPRCAASPDFLDTGKLG